MTPELESHHEAHRTGHRWVDFSVAGCALLVSFCSLGIAIHHGHTMEKLVQANSLPFLQFISSNGERRPDGTTAQVLSIQARNAGSGPARIEWFKSWLDERPFENWRTIIKTEHDQNSLTFTKSDIAPYFMKGGDSLNAIRWERTEQNAEEWDKFDAVIRAERVHVQACYCSIFDECWIADSKVFKPKSVPQC